MAEVAPIREDDPQRELAMATLDDALAAYPESPANPPPADAEPLDLELQLQSMKFYASARQRLADGQAAQALADLEKAARLDPTSPTIQRALGDANAAAGRRFAAFSAYQKAAALGMRDPALLGVLGREAVRARRFETAIPALRAACEEAAKRNETDLLVPLNVDLAEALIGAGRTAAGLELLEMTLEPLPDSPPEGVSMASQAEVFRRRAELWQRVGDLSMRLEDPARAEAAYARAATFPTVDPVSLVPRRIYACVRSGRTAEAALLLLAEMDRAQGRIEDRHLSTLAVLAQSPTVGPPLADAIAQMLRNPASDVAPSTASRLARASAACVPKAQAEAILMARMEAAPTDAGCLASLLAVYGDDDKGRAQAVVRLVANAPDQSDEYAEAFVRRGSGVAAALKWLEGKKSDGPSALLRAAMLRRLRRPHEALTALDQAKYAPDLAPAAAALRAWCAASAGRWDVALAAKTEALNFSEDKPARHQAAALIAVQDFGGAYENMAIDLGSPETAPGWRGVSDSLLAADLALRAGRPKDAETYLLAAQEADHFDERPYDALIDLYAPKGPLADDAKLTALARTLRDRIPSSKVARGLAARELLGRGLWDQAADHLRSMMDAEMENVGVLSLLALAWENLIKADAAAGVEAEAWIRERMKGREDSATLTIVLARVMSARGEAGAAVKMLEDANAALPNPDLLRMRDVLVRTSLDDPGRATELTVERLRGESQGIEGTIELAEAQISAARYDLGIAALTDGLPTEIPFTAEQKARLVQLVGLFKAEDIASGAAAQSEAAGRLFDLLLARGVDLPPQAHLLRVLAVCGAHPDETDRVYGVVQEAALKTGQTTPQMVYRVAQLLVARDNPSAGLRLLGTAVDRIEPFNDQLAFYWFSVTYSRGEIADMRFLTDSVKKPTEMLNTVVAQLGGDDAEPTTDQARRAELAYWLANGTSSMGREEIAEAAYRLALEYAPDHAWTLNNLGYLLLERGGHYEEAERMISEAYKTLHDDPSVIDSMGWLRYKGGVYNDGVDAQGKPVRGAISLLKEAVESGMKETNAEQTDHLGDALWRAGEKEEARRRWSQAQNLLQVQIAMSNARNPEESPAKVRFSKHLERVQAKLTAVREGREPAVEPTRAETEAGGGK